MELRQVLVLNVRWEMVHLFSMQSDEPGTGASLGRLTGGTVVKNSAANAEGATDKGLTLGQEDPPEKEMKAQVSVLAGKC